jgi:putative cell wall-binding protein
MTTTSAVLLTNDSAMPAETKNYLDSHSTVTRYAIGAPAAAADASATPVVGTDNPDTSRKVAEKFFTTPAAVAIANQATFADALSGGVHAALNGAPLLLTDPTALPATISAYLTNAKATTVIGFVYGGTAAVSEDVRNAAVQAIT